MSIKLFLIALSVLFIIDIIWLGLIAKNFYKNQIGFLMKDNINWISVVIFYLIFTIGLIYFVINPALEKGMWTHALFFGALFGFVAYATYDLTNLATIANWPFIVTFVDLIWGAILAGSVSTITYLIVDKIGA